MAILPRFYVYILYRPDGRPFYVGKGQGNRINAHESFARNGYKARRYSIIRKIWQEGGEVLKQKVYETDDQDDAYAMEHYLIASIGRENLANENEGGFGNHGYTPSADVRARISRTMTGRKLSAQWHARVQAAKIGKPRSEACKAKIREKLTGRKRDPESIKKGADAIRGRFWSERARQNIVAGIRGSTKIRPRGEAHHRSKWTVERVREIRQLYKNGVGPAEIARRLDMSKGAVTGILYSKRAWKWLDDGETQ